jgi:flagellar biosynthesis GTPase FlhF
MKEATVTSLSVPFILKLVGYILILSALLDYLFLLSNLDVQNKQMLGATMTQVVDRGGIPMIGLALVLSGPWLEQLAGVAGGRTKPVASLQFWALMASAILGVGFLVLVPIHLTNTQQVAEQQISQIGEQAKEAEGRVDQQVQQRQAELSELVKNNERFEQQMQQLQQAIESKQVPPAQLSQLQQLQKDLQDIKANPSALQNKAQESRNQLLNQIRSERQKQEKRVREEELKVKLRTSVSSLILSVGYIIISWLGFSDLGVFRKSARRLPNQP